MPKNNEYFLIFFQKGVSCPMCKVFEPEGNRRQNAEFEANQFPQEYEQAELPLFENLMEGPSSLEENQFQRLNDLIRLMENAFFTGPIDDDRAK